MALDWIERWVLADRVRCHLLDDEKADDVSMEIIGIEFRATYKQIQMKVGTAALYTLSAPGWEMIARVGFGVEAEYEIIGSAEAMDGHLSMIMLTGVCGTDNTLLNVMRGRPEYQKHMA